MVNVVLANVINASLNSYTAVPGNVTNPGYSFNTSSSTGLYYNEPANAVSLAYQGNHVLSANQYGLYANAVYANVDGSYLSGNIDAEVVIVEGAIDLSTDVVGVLPQQSLPASIGNVDTLYFGNAGTLTRPSYSFFEANSTGVFLSEGGNVGVSIEGVPTLSVHANGITVNGFVEGYLVSNASQLTTGQIDNARMPPKIEIDSFAGNAAQFEYLQSRHVQTSGLMSYQSTTDFLSANVITADHVAGNVITSQAFRGDGTGLSVDASNIVQGTLDNARLSPCVQVEHLDAGTISADGYLLSNIRTDALEGVIPEHLIPENIQLSHIQANSVQTESIQTLAVSAVEVAATEAAFESLQANNFTGSRAVLDGTFSGTFDGAFGGRHTGVFEGDGRGLSNISATVLSGTMATEVLPPTVNVQHVIASTLSTSDGSGISNIDASRVTVGTLQSSVLPDNLETETVQATSAQFNHLQTQDLQAANVDTTGLSASSAVLQHASITSLETGNISGNFSGYVSGIVSGNISGNGTGLYIDASNVMTGTLPNERLSPLVHVDALYANSYSGNAAGLENIDASNITSGTLHTNILPTTVVVEEVQALRSSTESSVSNATQSFAGQFGGVQANDAQFMQLRSDRATLDFLESSNIASNVVTAGQVATSPGTYLESPAAHRLSVVSNNITVALFSDVFSSLGRCTGYKEGSIVLNASDTCLHPATSGIFAKPIRGTPASTPVMTYNAVTGEINYNVSTRATKENIVDLGRDTSALYALRPREYDAIDGGQHHVGFIAEEVHEADPMFTWSEDGVVKGLDWFAMLTYAIAEIQRLRAIVENK